MDALRKSGVPPEAIDHFVHGTTVVINALTERKGAKTALVTTEGCRDVLAIGRANRPDIYNLRFRKQEPFVPRHLRFEVRERVHAARALVANGEELVPVGGLGEVLKVIRESDPPTYHMHFESQPGRVFAVPEGALDPLPGKREDREHG